MLAYLKGDRVALAIDAGNSADHVDQFYNALEVEGLRKPDITVVTHWHWDHTFGMHRIHGLSIAQNKTNEFLKTERSRLSDRSYMEFIKKDDKYLNREYQNNKKITIVLSDIQFDKELILNLGGMTAMIFHAETPHSEDSVIIDVPEEKVLFLGDATSEDFFNNNYMDKEKLMGLAKLVESIDCQYCVLSHAAP